MNDTIVKNGYSPTHNIKLYYESYGEGGTPLILLPGVLSGIQSAFGKIIPQLAKTRQVIAIDPRGFGHTADIDAPLSYEEYERYIVDLLQHLNIKQADILGYSTGASVALLIGMNQPQLVRKLVVCSATFNSNGLYPEVTAAYNHLSAEALTGTPYEVEHMKSTPHPEDWPKYVEKVKAFNLEEQQWSPEDIKKIVTPVLVVVGDSDIVQPEHAVELFRLLGGGKAGDFAGLPESQLAILPGVTHMALTNGETPLVPIVIQFLDR